MIRSWRLSPSFHCLRLVPGEPSGFGPNSTRLAVFSSIQGRTLSSARARGDQPLATARHDSFRPSKRLKTQPRPPIAVLGGGLSGLTTTLYLSRLLPDRRILLVESSNHLGGWVRSERVALPQGGHAIVEAGPRSIRPKGAAGWIMIEMIHSLGLMDQMIIIPSNAPSAKNRYIYFASQLNKLPSSLGGMVSALFRLPLLRSLLPAALSGLTREPLRPSRFARPTSESKGEVERQRQREYMLDESVESFIRRRFGDRFGSKLLNNMLSAVLHGIYAADTRDLSVRSTLPFLWQTEQRYGSLLRAMLPVKWNRRYREPTESQTASAKEDAQTVDRAKVAVGAKWSEKLDKASVFSLQGGLQTIIEAMLRELATRRNVSISTGDDVQNILQSHSKRELYLRTNSGEDLPATQLISTIPSAKLAELFERSAEKSSGASPISLSTSALSILRHNRSTDVAVVTFAIPSSAVPEHMRGRRLIKAEEAFGFLIPRAEASRNPDGILGVVFDSDAIPGQDETVDDAAVTKVTVMMGGPHFKALKAAGLPSLQDCRDRAVRSLERFLSIPPSISTHPDSIVRARMQEACIPTYAPGHFSRMRRLHSELERHDGLLTLAGASYTGVSVNDVVYHARKTAERVAAAEDSKGREATGLEMFTVD